MKLILCTVCIALCAMVLVSCKKQDPKITPLASIQIINAVAGGGTLQFATNVAPVYNNYFQAYSILTGNKEITLTDTARGINKVYYNQRKDFANGGVYSLFLGGTPDAVEAVFMKDENIPSHTANVFGVRVINMVKDGVRISVNISGVNGESFIPILAYKAISTFKDVSSVTAEGDKVFEFRNAVTSDLITSFTVPSYDLPRFRNITLVLAGIVDAETVVRVNNY